MTRLKSGCVPYDDLPAKNCSECQEISDHANQAARHTSLPNVGCREGERTLTQLPKRKAMTVVKSQPNAVRFYPIPRMHWCTHCNKPHKSVTQTRARLVEAAPRTLWTPGGSCFRRV
jgi:hypothetical protein